MLVSFVPLSPLLHVAGFGRPVAVESSPVAPFGVELNTVRRISNHQTRLALAQEPDDNIRIGGVSAEHSVRPKQPQIPRPGRRRFGKRRRGVGFFLIIERQQIVDLAWVESSETQIEVRFLDFLQLKRE